MSVELDTPLNPDIQYRYLELDNKLGVLLIRDAESEQTAASLSLGLGSHSDPEELPGLAHFCEHMLFMGTEKYPNEAEYRSFIQDKGGYCNAYTAGEVTNYHFSLPMVSALDGALDRFAQFFIAPLFHQGSTDRELKQINSEHEKNIQNDVWRFWQLLKDYSNKDFPWHKFGTGNNVTLIEEPKEKGIDIRQRLLEMVKNQSSHLMKLSVYSSHPLDELEAMVKKYFSPIPLNEKATRLTYSGLPYTDNEFGYWMDVVPVKQAQSVSLIFCHQHGEEAYESKPEHCVSHLIGHESEGSVLHFLRKEGLAEELVSGSIWSGQNWSIFHVTIEMTTKGYEQLDTVITSVFQYIEALKETGFQDYVWEELKTIAEMEFKYSEIGDPVSTVTGYSSDMLQFKPEHTLSGNYKYAKVDRKKVNDVIQALSVDKMNVVLSCQQLSDVCTESSAHYGAKFRRTRIDPDRKKKWMCGTKNPKLFLPQKNPFLPESFALQEIPKDVDVSVPMLIVDNDQCQVWWKQDDTFKVPKVQAYWNVITPVAYNTPRNRAMWRIYQNIFKDRLNNMSYFAEMANLTFRTVSTMMGFYITVDGFDNKVSTLAETIFSVLANLSVDETIFEMWRDKTRRTISNQLMDDPYEKVIEITNSCIFQTRWLARHIIPEFDKISLDDFQRYLKEMDTIRIESFVMGNISKNTVLQLHEKLCTVYFNSKQALPKDKVPWPIVIQLPKGNDVMNISTNDNEDDTNSAVEVTMHFGIRTTAIVAVLDVLLNIMDTQFFSALRSVECLGYIVATTPRTDSVVEGFRFIVQSADYGCLYLYSRILCFIDAFTNFIAKDLSEEQLQESIDAEVAKREDKAKSLNKRANYFWKEIGEYREFMWDRDDQEVVALKALTVDKVRQFWKSYCTNESEERCMISSAIAGKEHKEEVNSINSCKNDQKPTFTRKTDFPKKQEPKEDEKDTENAGLLVTMLDECKPQPEAKTLWVSDIPAFKASCSTFPALMTKA